MVNLPGPGSGAGSGGNFLEQLLGDLLKMMGSGATGGGARVELARTLAHGVASGGEAEANVEPVDRIALEELVRLAAMHVAELTDLPVAPVEVLALAPGSWAWHTVEDWRYLLESMSPPGAVDVNALAGGLGLAGGSEEGGAGELLARWMATMGPMLAAMQLGSAIGHLARSTFGSYELPVPRPEPRRLLLVPANITSFAADWSLPLDQVRLWVCLREVTTAAVLDRPHVADRLRDLLSDVVAGISEGAGGMLQRLEGLDPSDPESLQRLLGEPETLFEAEPSPARQQASERLMAVTAALLGYVEHTLDRAASRLLGGRTAMTEAWRRRQVDRESGERAAEMLIGLDLGPAQIDRGVAFVEGVVERAGEAGLRRLWERAATLPTPAEIDAPGLWLERISFEPLGSDGRPEGPGPAGSRPDRRADPPSDGGSGDGGWQAGS